MRYAFASTLTYGSTHGPRTHHAHSRRAVPPGLENADVAARRLQSLCESLGEGRRVHDAVDNSATRRSSSSVRIKQRLSTERTLDPWNPRLPGHGSRRGFRVK